MSDPKATIRLVDSEVETRIDCVRIAAAMYAGYPAEHQLVLRAADEVYKYITSGVSPQESPSADPSAPEKTGSVTQPRLSGH